MHKSTTSAIWLAAVAVIALVAKPTSAWAQNPKTFTEYVNEIIETQQEQDEPEGERVFFTPYLTNDTHYMVISDIIPTRCTTSARAHSASWTTTSSRCGR